ncbi:helicase RepA family protein [Polynucleobacter sp. UB-Piko-W3]|uniref:helicase RepA family protein n=1 Tax=Polynucleobacter sp. UB-Piko-W3 TaxID=1819735 RepID=UPI001C0D384B|nr:helicase RepA family protein [Polynucleobacter sp. UB-Piko-W3]MBU3554844.1 AAA family ATPase [Polynucleobacter sp. UB-Piko-W3]
MHYESAESIAKALGNARKSGTGWSCRCPAHDDRNNSLSVSQGKKQNVVVCCHAGCAQDDVINELKIKGLWTTKPKAAPIDSGVAINYDTLGKKGEVSDKPPVVVQPKIVATYPYTDENGVVLYECVRYEPKDFRQRRPLDNGGWVWSLKDVIKVPYNLPMVLLGIRNGDVIYIVEGEKDVEAAKSIGLVATCNPMGADNGSGNKWLKHWGEIFDGAEVVIVPDQDEPGMRHANWVRSTLVGHAANIYIANPTTGKDLADWIGAGAGTTHIEEATKIFDSPGDEQLTTAIEIKPNLFLRVDELIENIKPIDWLIENFVETDSLTLVYGAPSSGKSFLTIDWAMSVATGTKWLGKHDAQQGGAYYIAAEGLNGMSRRFRAWTLGRNISIKGAPLYQSSRGIQVLDEDTVDFMASEIEQIALSTGMPPRIAVIDTVARSFGDGDENSTADMSRFIQIVDDKIRKRFRITVVLVHHSGHEGTRARGSSALRAAVDAEFGVAKDASSNVTIICTKMKEAEIAPDVMLKIRGIPLGIMDAKGHEVTGGLLVESDDLINARVAQRTKDDPILAHEVLAILDRGWLSIRDLQKALDCPKRQAENALSGLRKYGFVGKDAVTQEGKDALSRTGHQLLQNDKPVWQRTGVSNAANNEVSTDIYERLGTPPAHVIANGSAASHLQVLDNWDNDDVL